MKDRSPRERYLRKIKLDKIKIFAIRVGILAAFIAVWELGARLGFIDAFFVSSPSRIVRTFIDLAGNGLWRHVGITLYECTVGFAVSTAVGLLLAAGLWWNRTARRVAEPYLVVLNALPKIALGPVIIIWAGAGTNAIILTTFLICIIVTVMSISGAFLAVDGGKLFLLESMGASKLQVLTKLVLPASVPALISVLKVNVGLAWVGTIMGEYLVSGAGLGYLIIYGGQVFRLDLVMTSTVILCVLAGLMYSLVRLLEKLTARYSADDQAA